MPTKKQVAFAGGVTTVVLGGTILSVAAAKGKLKNPFKSKQTPYNTSKMTSSVIADLDKIAGNQGGINPFAVIARDRVAGNQGGDRARGFRAKHISNRDRVAGNQGGTQSFALAFADQPRHVSGGGAGAVGQFVGDVSSGGLATIPTGSNREARGGPGF